jgi:hypothetical protein
MIRSKDIFLQQQEAEFNYITQQPKKRTVMETRDLLNELFKECNLNVKEDIYEGRFGSRKIKIITRSGIEKIQYTKSIKISFEAIKVEKDFCVVKATGELDGEIIETFGSAAKETSHNKYYMEMAEKRALSRVVLKLTKAYSFDVYGEDESDAFKQEIKDQNDENARTNLKKLAKK